MTLTACATTQPNGNIATPVAQQDGRVEQKHDSNASLPGKSSSTNASVTPINDDAPPIATIDLTTPSADLWQRVRLGFSMPDLHSPLVADRQAWYLNHPEQLRIMMQRSQRYIYHIVNELQKRGMPTELALLPMVESSYNPKAASSAQALGIWQFIPSTGRSYGLEKNWYLDERRDVISSTQAALDYLQRIYEMHGDWHLALASYNWGEGAVGRAIAKNRAQGLRTDYASLTMPEETRMYVPKLQALKNIIADPALFGIKLAPIANRPYFATIDTKATMDVATAAKLAEISIDEFNALNPAYHSRIIPGSSDAPLVLPTGNVAAFKSNLALYQDQDKPLSRWRTYTPKRGEKYLAIAKRNRISLSYLKQVNGLGARDRISKGNTLLLPAGQGNSATDDASSKSAARATKSTVRGKPGKTVKPKTTRKAVAGKAATSKGKAARSKPARKATPKKK